MDINSKELELIGAEVSRRIPLKIITEHNSGTLKQFLNALGMSDLIRKYQNEEQFLFDPYGKILIIGVSRLKIKHIEEVCMNLKISKDRLEFIND